MKKYLKVIVSLFALIIITLISAGDVSANGINPVGGPAGLSEIQIVAAFLLLMAGMLLPLFKKSNRQAGKK